MTLTCMMLASTPQRMARGLERRERVCKAHGHSWTDVLAKAIVLHAAQTARKARTAEKGGLAA